jgi:predicted esterase
MTRYIFLSLLLISGLLKAQPTKPEDYGLKAFHLKDPKLGRIDYYLSESGIDQKKPLLIALDGSGNFPLAIFVQKTKGSEVMNSFDQDLLGLSDRFHILLIGKPGIPFCDTIQTDTTDFEHVVAKLPSPKAFLNKNSLYWRVQAVSKVLDRLMKEIPIDKFKIIAYGYSEGAQVAPALAVSDKRITHCAAVMGSGLNQFYDFITAVRIRTLKKEITEEVAQQQIDSLFLKFKDIYTHPNATDQQWEGNTYKRWASYCSDIPMENLLKLNIPIFMTAGSQDTNSPIYGIEYIRLDFLRKHKQNLTFKTYPTDHFFSEHYMDNGQPAQRSYKKQMLADFLNWIE